MRSQTAGQKYITIRGVATRWSCSTATVKRKIANDPNMPKVVKLMRFDLLILDELEQYERMMAAQR